MRLTPDIEDLVTRIVARDIAAGVELARSIGFQMPANFAIGVRFLHEGEHTRVRMRLDDATHDAIVRLPDLEGRQSLRETDSMWQRAWQRIHGDALTVAQVWIDKHPEATVQKDGVTRAVAILDALKADDDLHARWVESCRERAKSFKYRSA